MRDISKEFGLNYLISKRSPPSYTLAELKAQAEEYTRRADFITESEALTYELHLSMFIAWLAKQEQGRSEG